jgi:glutathione S-transferase
MTILYCESHWDSPFVFTAFVALMEKGLPFQTKVLDLGAGQQKEAAFQELSLTARVPTIEHDGFWLSESTAIVEYLDEFMPPPAPRLLPADLNDRARARQLLGWLRSDLAALRRERPSSSLFFQPASAPLGEAAESDARKLVRIANQLLSSGPTLFDAFSIADADLAFAMMRLIANGDPVPERLQAYVRGIWLRPSVQAYVNQPRSPAP